MDSLDAVKRIQLQVYMGEYSLNRSTKHHRYFNVKCTVTKLVYAHDILSRILYTRYKSMDNKHRNGID